MKFLDLTLPTAAENLALDEALLASVDSKPSETLSLGQPSRLSGVSTYNSDDCGPSQVLRVWRATQPFVVLGRSSHVAQEVHTERARLLEVPILRRFSGGASVLVAPGCLLYSLLIHLDSFPGLRMLNVAHRFVMERMLQAIQRFEPNAYWNGTCDLVLDGRKFSGNSLRVGRQYMLYHGILLLNMQLSLMDDLLQHPPREPEYRAGRPHRDFVANLGIDQEMLINALRQEWKAEMQLQDPPLARIPLLVNQRYGNDDWNFQR